MSIVPEFAPGGAAPPNEAKGAIMKKPSPSLAVGVLIGLAYCLVCFAPVAGASSTSADSSSAQAPAVYTVKGTRLLGDAWTYNVDLGQGSTVQATQVALPDGSSQGSATLTLAPGQAGFSVAEGAEPGTLVVTRGLDSGTPAGGSSVTGGSAARLTSGAEASGGAAALATTHSAGYYKSWFEDPVGLDLNRVTDTADWYWNGSRVSNAHGSYTYWWFSTDGWRKNADNFSCTYASDMSYVTANSYVDYRHPIGTWCKYNRNDVRGHGNGNLTGSCTWSKGGTGSSLLSFKAEIKRTLN
jgi:hypothetical protein